MREPRFRHPGREQRKGECQHCHALRGVNRSGRLRTHTYNAPDRIGKSHCPGSGQEPK